MTLPGIEPRPITDLVSQDTRPGVHCKVPRVEGPCFPQCPYPRSQTKEEEGPSKGCSSRLQCQFNPACPSSPRTVPAPNPSEL